MEQDMSQNASSQEASEPLLLTIAQAAKSLSISRAMLYALLAKNEGPPVIRLGRSVRVSAASLRRWVEEQEGEQRLK
jgi:excisionase family DNA binding protein